MMKKQAIKIFVERNMGHGFEKAYPPMPAWLFRFYMLLLGKPKQPLTKHFGFLIYYRNELDVDCPDPRSKGRSPSIEMFAVFPWRFDEKHLYSEVGNTLLKQCWEVASLIMQKGANTNLGIDIPSEWYQNN